jgi:hypothetical protein
MRLVHSLKRGEFLKAILAAKGNEVVSIVSTADLAAASKLLKEHQIGVL